MNNQLRQLEKLGKDVENFEKRFNKAFQGIRNEEVASNVMEKRSICTPDVPAKSKASTNFSKSRHSKPLNPKDRQPNCTIVEVKVKTKRHGKARKTKSGKNVMYTKSLTTNKPPKDPIQSERNRRHGCCSESTKTKNNIAWGNILRQSVDKMSTSSPGIAIGNQGPRSKAEDNAVRSDFSEAYRLETLPVCVQNSNFRRSVSSEGSESENPDHDEYSNEQHSGVKWSRLNNKNRQNRKVEGGKSMKSPTTLRSLEGTKFKGSVPLKPFETLHFLIEELRDRVTTTADQSTQKLIEEIRIALDRVSKTTPCTSEASFRTKFSPKTTADKKQFINTSAKNNLEIGNSSRIPSESHLSTLLKDKIAVQSNCIGSDVDGQHTDATCRSNEDHQALQKNKQESGPHEFSNSLLQASDKLQLPAKLNIDSNTRNQYALDYDEKMKAELEYLNKQLNLQLKSVEGITMKESEYKKLIANLIEKVDKLEAQVTEQSKVTHHFYAQSNALLKQNSVIPMMQKSHDQLREELQDTIRNYEKLKVEYCLVKLEKEKYYTLNCEKEKQLSRFKAEIMNIQSLVVQQMENVRKYEGYSSASEKVDNILSMIDTQSTLIRSRIKGVRDLDGKHMPIPGSPTTSNSSARSRPLSPFSPSLKLNSPNERNFSPLETGWPEGNNMGNT